MNSTPLVAFFAALLFACDGSNPISPELHGPESAQEHGTAGESGNGGSEAGEPGTLYGISETARQSRSGIDLVMSYDQTSASFVGSVTNSTGASVADVRVEIHLSNGVELGPTPLQTLNARQESPVVLDARGESFSTWQVHIEIGQDEH